MEYNNTRLWKLEDKVSPENLDQRLQIIFGRTNAVREAVDKALEKDDEIRRRTNMRYLESPTRFPTPDTMHVYEPSRWITWIQDETQRLLEGLNEEIRLLNEIDDPFVNTPEQQIPRNKGEIPPVEKLATPLVPEKVDNPLPQRTKPITRKGTDEIPPANTQEPVQNTVQGKPPTHNIRPAKRQINYDSAMQPQEYLNANWEQNSPYIDGLGNKKPCTDRTISAK